MNELRELWDFLKPTLLIIGVAVVSIYVLFHVLTAEAKQVDKPAGIALAASRFQIASLETIPGVAASVKLLIVRDHEQPDHCYFMVLDSTHVSAPVPIACF